MRKIGMIADGGKITEAPVILNEVGEREGVETESLVKIDNKGGNEIIAVCREGLGSNPDLPPRSYSPGVAYARKGKEPTGSKESKSFTLSTIGEITDDGLKQNKRIISPRSDVFLYEKKDNPFKDLYPEKVENGLTVGYFAGKENWRIPIKELLNYHIGVFGTTGSGKTCLIRNVLIPLIEKSGYELLIFDWKGTDYAPYFESVELPDIALNNETVFSYLKGKLDNFGYSDNGKLLEYLRETVYSGRWRGWEKGNFKQKLRNELEDKIKNRSRREKGHKNRLKNCLPKLDKEDLDIIFGSKSAEDLLEMVREEKKLVVDMSRSEKYVKLSVFLNIVRHIRDRMYQGKDMNISLIIDEGAMYCPYHAEGLQNTTKGLIKELCALGRSYELPIVLASQGIKGKIGLDAAVRRNLNTKFIGQLGPVDRNTAAREILPEIDTDFLKKMRIGHFYFSGKMNPSPVPILMSYDLKYEEGK